MKARIPSHREFIINFPDSVDQAKANEGWAKLQQIVEDYKKAHNGASVYAPTFIEDFLAFHHIHKPHRHANDQCRPQTGFHFLDLICHGLHDLGAAVGVLLQISHLAVCAGMTAGGQQEVAFQERVTALQDLKCFTHCTSPSLL